MACLHPITVPNPALKTANARIAALLDIPPTIRVPCGRCSACMKARARSWRIRMLEEFRGHPDSHPSTVLLTLSPEAFEKYKDSPNEPIRIFTERFRKKYGFSLVRIFFTELGDTGGRLHYHGIIFNHFFNPVLPFKGAKYGRCAELEKLWTFGICSVWAYTNEKTMNYITKYLTKPCKYDPTYKGKVFASHGLGKCYLTPSRVMYHVTTMDLCYNDGRGHTMALPLYYFRKIFDSDMKYYANHFCVTDKVMPISYKGIKFDSQRKLDAFLLDEYNNSIRRKESRPLVSVEELRIHKLMEFYAKNYEI